MGKKENLEAAEKLVKTYEDFLKKYPEGSFNTAEEFYRTFKDETGFGDMKTCSLCKASGYDLFNKPICFDCIHSFANGHPVAPCTYTVGYEQLHSVLIPLNDKYTALQERIIFLRTLIEKAREYWTQEQLIKISEGEEE